MIAKDMTIEQLYSIFSQLNHLVNPFGATIQCIHESSYSGQPFGAGLAIEANNLAGLKATNSWTGKTVDRKTWEQRPDGSKYQIIAKWRAWATVEEFALSYSEMIDHTYPLCSKDNFMGYFSGLFKGKYGAWATDLSYFTKLLTVAWRHAPTFFERPNEKWKMVLINAADRKLFIIPKHQELAVIFTKENVSNDNRNP